MVATVRVPVAGVLDRCAAGAVARTGTNTTTVWPFRKVPEPKPGFHSARLEELTP